MIKNWRVIGFVLLITLWVQSIQPKQEMPNNEFYFFNGDMVSYIENEDASFKGPKHK
jgi:hypothetical protein